MKAYFSKRAARAAERIDDWWRANGREPGLFASELLAAVERLEALETPGVAYPTQRHPELRRILLPLSHCHLYFEIDRRAQVLRILHIWDGRRRAPHL